MLQLLAKEPQEYPLSDAYQRLSPAFVTEDEVDAVLMQGGTYTDSQWDTYVYFRTCESPSERQKYLREQFGTGGQSSVTYSWDYDSKGLSLERSYDGKAYDAVHRTWAAAEKRVTELIQKGLYLQGASQADYAAYSRRKLAQEVFQLLHRLPPAEGLTATTPCNPFWLATAPTHFQRQRAQSSCLIGFGPIAGRFSVGPGNYVPD